MTKRMWLMAVLALSAATMVGCGGDDEESPTDAGGTGGGGGSDSGGSGGSDSGGSGGGGGSGGSTAPMAMPIECGSNTCNPPPNPLGGLAAMIPGGAAGLPMAYACCLEDDSCGYAMSANATGAACAEPAVADERCPDFMLSFPGLPGGGDAGAAPGGIMAGFGCCVDNQCGVDGSTFGGGCNENSEARTMLTAAIPMFGAIIAAGVPAPQACDAPQPDGGDGDGDDAGN